MSLKPPKGLTQDQLIDWYNIHSDPCGQDNYDNTGGCVLLILTLLVLSFVFYQLSESPQEKPKTEQR